MTHPTSLFADLPAPLADAMRELRWPDDTYFEKVGRVFSAVAYPEDFCGVRAETLTPDQRAVAIALTELDLPSPLRSAFPQQRADRRRWLGLDPAGPLEQIVTFTIDDVTYVEPIWRMAKIVHGRWNTPSYQEVAQRFDAQFSIEERLRLWGEVNNTQPRVWNLSGAAFFNYGQYPTLIDQLPGECQAWAIAYLDGVLAQENANLEIRDLVPAFMTLVRAGAPIEPRWDALLELRPRYGSELALALPEQRRASTCLSALARMHPSSALFAAIELLPVVPEVAIAEYALTCIPKTVGSPRAFRRALREAAGTQAHILALIDAADAAAGPPLLLTATQERSIAEEGPSAVFSELDHAQLLVAGKRYLGGKGAPIEVLLADNPQGPDEERSLRGQLFYRAIADAKGKHVYDAWLYQTDSGIIFTSGTTRVVAEYVQRSVTCKNDRLAEALDDALRAEPSAVTQVPAPPKKRTARKKAGKKGA